MNTRAILFFVSVFLFSGTVFADPPSCPNSLYRYQCDGVFAPKNYPFSTTMFTGEFTGPPPEQVTMPQGLVSWMKIKFAAKYPWILIGTEKYYYMAALNCRPIGPAN